MIRQCNRIFSCGEISAFFFLFQLWYWIQVYTTKYLNLILIFRYKWITIFLCSCWNECSHSALSLLWDPWATSPVLYPGPPRFRTSACLGREGVGPWCKLWSPFPQEAAVIHKWISVVYKQRPDDLFHGIVNWALWGKLIRYSLEDMCGSLSFGLHQLGRFQN